MYIHMYTYILGPLYIYIYIHLYIYIRITLVSNNEPLAMTRNSTESNFSRNSKFKADN